MFTYAKVYKLSPVKKYAEVITMTAKETDNNNEANITKLQEEISNFFEDIMYEFGGSPLLGRIYGKCVIHPESSFLQKDFSDIFKVNASTISRNVKELENWGLISKRREPGSREWQYQLADTSFLELFLHTFEENKNKLQEKREDLLRIKNHWGFSSKESQSISVLSQLLEWIEVVELELENFITHLNKRYLEIEKKNI